MMISTKELAIQLGIIRKRKVSNNLEDGSKQKKGSPQVFSYLIILDFESTCWKDKFIRSRQEIIEFPAVLLNTSNGNIETEFHYYVQPEEYPFLSNFCKEFTGITQDQVENGIPLRACLFQFSKWLHEISEQYNFEYNFQNTKNKLCTFATWTDWDLGVMLLQECNRKQIRKPNMLNCWIDLKITYKNFYDRKPTGLTGALQDVGIEFEGREHSGLDDARNTAKLAWKMVNDGCILQITKNLNNNEKPVLKTNSPKLLRQLNTRKKSVSSIQDNERKSDENLDPPTSNRITSVSLEKNPTRNKIMSSSRNIFDKENFCENMVVEKISNVNKICPSCLMPYSEQHCCYGFKQINGNLSKDQFRLNNLALQNCNMSTNNKEIRSISKPMEEIKSILKPLISTIQRRSTKDILTLLEQSVNSSKKTVESVSNTDFKLINNSISTKKIDPKFAILDDAQLSTRKIDELSKTSSIPEQQHSFSINHDNYLVSTPNSEISHLKNKYTALNIPRQTTETQVLKTVLNTSFERSKQNSENITKSDIRAKNNCSNTKKAFPKFTIYNESKPNTCKVDVLTKINTSQKEQLKSFSNNKHKHLVSIPELENSQLENNYMELSDYIPITETQILKTDSYTQLKSPKKKSRVKGNANFGMASYYNNNNIKKINSKFTLHDDSEPGTSKIDVSIKRNIFQEEKRKKNSINRSKHLISMPELESSELENDYSELIDLTPITETQMLKRISNTPLECPNQISKSRTLQTLKHKQQTTPLLGERQLWNNYSDLTCLTPVTDTQMWKTSTPLKISESRINSYQALQKSVQQTMPVFTPQRKTPPLCNCGKRAHYKSVFSPGPNEGRYFYACSKGKVPKGCGFFRWDVLYSPNNSITNYLRMAR